MKKSAYSTVFAEGAFLEDSTVVTDVLREATGSERPRVMLVADMNVVQRTEGLGVQIGRYFKAHGLELVASPAVLPGGEKIKGDNMQSAMSVVDAAIEAKIGANDVMLVLGGGTVLDVAGWAASQVRGGVRLVRVPTTITAMVEAAHGLYAALNFESVKDALRVPSVPAAVVVDTTFAKSVMDGVWRAGFSEFVRTAAIYDAALFSRLEELAEPFAARDFSAMTEAVRETVAVRQKKGATTFGCWSALRLESMSGYKLPHGYATSIGLALDATYAQLAGIMDADDKARICGLLEKSGAMDGVQHSRHLLGQSDSILRGLDAWRLANGSEAIELPKGIGKKTVVENPDRDTIKQAVNMLK